MDWITFTKQQVDDDALPSVCMVCGVEATDRVNKTFSHSPEWVEHLYWVGGVPGVIAESFFTTKMRVACPLCPDHLNHWRKLVLVASTGWLVSLPPAGIGYLVGTWFFSGSATAPYVGLGTGAAIGLIPWLAVVIRLATTRVKATNITADEITFQRVADVFVRAAKREPETSP